MTKMGRVYVAELIKELGISRKSLYNWEKAGKIPKAKREPISRYRFYDPKDVQKMKRLVGRG